MNYNNLKPNYFTTDLIFTFIYESKTSNIELLLIVIYYEHMSKTDDFKFSV